MMHTVAESLGCLPSLLTSDALISSLTSSLTSCFFRFLDFALVCTSKCSLASLKKQLSFEVLS